MKRVSREQGMHFMFDKEIPPVMRVAPREIFALETEDNTCGRIKSDRDLPTSEVLSDLLETSPILGNPLNGPVYLDGAQKGDVLVVKVVDVIPADQGYTALVPGTKSFNPLRDSASWPECQGPLTRIIKHVPGPSGTTSDGKGIFNPKITWDLKPFIGTIGVAPELEVVSSVSGQGAWGGNLDCRDISKGNELHLPVRVDGGLLFVGDAHATQSDSEFTGLADECRAEVVLSCDVIKKKTIPYARIQKPNSIIQLNNGLPLERSITQAFLWLMEWLVDEYKMDKRDACMHMSANPDLRINVYQMAGGLATVGVEFPKKYLV